MNFDQGTNILYGDNAQGKTNILEALGIPYPNDGEEGRSFIQNRHAPPEKQSKGSCHQRAADPQGKGAAGGGESGVFFSGGS